MLRVFFAQVTKDIPDTFHVILGIVFLHKKLRMVPNIGLRTEKSQYNSGYVNSGIIPVLKEKDYYVKEVSLDGDAPKQFIKAYFFRPDSGFKRKSRKS